MTKSAPSELPTPVVASRGTFYGYDFRSTQPCIRSRFELPREAFGDLAQVDEWLAKRFFVDADDLAAVQAIGHEGEYAVVRGAIDRVLLLYGELARAANFPCFDRGTVLGVTPSAEDAGVTASLIALPVVDNVPQQVFMALLDAALQVVRSCSHTPPSNEEAERIFAGPQELIEKLAAMSPFVGASVIPVCRIAHRRGIPFRHIGGGYIRLGFGREGRLLNKSSVERDSTIGAAMCLDKRVTARLLRAAGMPGAEHVTVTSPETALAAAREFGWPVVVKPADKERSVGVTAGITDEDALLAAYEKAREASAKVLVERHVAGTCHRILVAADKVFYVVNRLPKRVEGNGRDTVAALAEGLNARIARLPPWKPFPRFVVDDLARECLAKDGLTPDSVLAEGQIAYLRPLATPEWGGGVEDLTERIHPANAELAIVATRLFGLKVAGVDLMTSDIARPWYENGAIINEMNFRPALAIGGREVDASILGEALVRGTGRIPVHLITGSGDLATAARRVQARLAQSGRGCHWTSAAATFGPDGNEVYITGSSLFERALALSLRPDVREIVIAGRPDEFRDGLAVDRLETALVVEPDAARAERLLRQLRVRFAVQSAAIVDG